MGPTRSPCLGDLLVLDLAGAAVTYPTLVDVITAICEVDFPKPPAQLQVGIGPQDNDVVAPAKLPANAEDRSCIKAPSSYRLHLVPFLIITTQSNNQTTSHNNNTFQPKPKQPPHQSTWIPSSLPPTTSRTRSRAPPTRLPRRRTRTSPRTRRPPSALGKHLHLFLKQSTVSLTRI